MFQRTEMENEIFAKVKSNGAKFNVREKSKSLGKEKESDWRSKKSWKLAERKVECKKHKYKRIRIY